MKVWFGCTTARWKEYKDYYLGIRKYLKDIGCTLVFDWMPTADEYYETSYKTRNITEIYQNVIKAIDDSEIVIIEYTIPNFSVSHQINYALLKQKQILILRQLNDNPRFADSYLEALNSPLITIKDYSNSNYEKYIKEFIGYSQLEQGQKRYNIVLDKKQKQYLDWASSKYKKSRSEIIRKNLDKAIDKDQNYKKYLQ